MSKNPYNKPFIDILVDGYFPKPDYSKKIRMRARSMALEFHREISKEKAMQEEINKELLFGTENK